jgi:hypothetical protein
LLYQAARPADLEKVDFAGRAEAEVQPEIVLRKETTAAANLVNLA